MFARVGTAAVLILGFLSSPSYGKAPVTEILEQSGVVRFRLRDNYKVTDPVSVNGTEAVSFILDAATPWPAVLAGFRGQAVQANMDTVRATERKAADRPDPPPP